MTDPNELGVALTSIANALQDLDVPWAIVGSLASSVHGEPRATNDLDIVADRGYLEAVAQTAGLRSLLDRALGEHD